MHMRNVLFLAVTHRRQGRRKRLGLVDLRRWDRYVVPKRRYGFTTLTCVISQKSVDLEILLLLRRETVLSGRQVLALLMQHVDRTSQ
jgi:hypothetical protein